MKTANIITAFTTGAMALCLYSCENFYNPDTETLLAEKENYSDYLSSRASVNGLYALAQDQMDAYIVNGELKGDLLTLTSGAGEDLLEIYNHQYGMDNPYVDIRPAYKLIANANDVIRHLKEIYESGTSYDADLQNMIAEASIIRTWTYFYLIRNYTHVPYLAEDYTASGAEVPLEEWLSEHTSRYADVSGLIQDATGVIGLFQAESYTSTEFFNIASANALLGEMYLWNNEYEQAVDALLTSILSADYTRYILGSDLQGANWVNIFKGDESATDEIMTKILFDKAEKQENSLLEMFSSITRGGPELLPTQQAYALFSNIYRIEGTFNSGEEVAKYTRSLDQPYTSDMPVILYRAADVHLMLAEAYNRMGEVNLALDLVNNGNDSLFTAFSKGIRGRVGLAPVTVKGETLQDSIIDLEDKIIEERARELAFEGKRWYDLVRIASRRDDPTFISNKMAGKYPDLDQSEIEDYYLEPEHWFIPLDY